MYSTQKYSTSIDGGNGGGGAIGGGNGGKFFTSFLMPSKWPPLAVTHNWRRRMYSAPSFLRAAFCCTTEKAMRRFFLRRSPELAHGPVNRRTRGVWPPHAANLAQADVDRRSGPLIEDLADRILHAPVHRGNRPSARLVAIEAPVAAPDRPLHGREGDLQSPRNLRLLMAVGGKLQDASPFGPAQRGWHGTCSEETCWQLFQNWARNGWKCTVLTSFFHRSDIK